MIDIGNAKYDFSKEEEYAIKWFNENGFDGKLEKQYVSKTVFSLSKDGVTDKFVLPQGIVFSNIAGYMEQYRRNWELTCELQKLEKEE